MGYILAIATLSPSGFAALGGTSESVKSDQTQMKAKLKATPADAYSIHEITAPTGTVVREYVSPDGRVFGISWQGPFVPDLRQLLGDYFLRYSEATKIQREKHVGRQPLNIREPKLVVQTAGHPRSYFGRAYDPELLPAGVSADDVQ
jgi:Protein of unknown function (DUF2844)